MDGLVVVSFPRRTPTESDQVSLVLHFEFRTRRGPFGGFRRFLVGVSIRFLAGTVQVSGVTCRLKCLCQVCPPPNATAAAGRKGRDFLSGCTLWKSQGGIFGSAARGVLHGEDGSEVLGWSVPCVWSLCGWGNPKAEAEADGGCEWLHPSLSKFLDLVFHDIYLVQNSTVSNHIRLPQ